MTLPASQTPAAPPTAVPPLKRAHPALGAAASAGLLLSLSAAAAAALVMTFPGLAHSVSGRIPHGKTELLLPAGAVGAVIAGAYACQAMRSLLSQARIADTLTSAAAFLATCASASGMWAFFARFVSRSVVEQASLFGFLEVCAIALAVRARILHRNGRPAGADLAGMRAATALSACLASMAATSPAEAVFRFTTPLAAAWMWERAIASDSSLAGAHGNARERPARLSELRQWILASLGPVARGARSSSGEALDRRLVIALALAAERSGTLDATKAAAWRRRSAARRLRSATRAAAPVLADNPDERAYLATLVQMLGSRHDLAAAAARSRWNWLPQDPAGRAGLEDAAGGHEALVGDLAESLYRKDFHAIHSVLAGRDDYPGLVRWIASHDITGGKQLLALVALYADPECRVPARIARWIAQQIKDLPGTGEYAIPDHAEISRVRDALTVNAAPPGSPGAVFARSAA